jgi:hypothetical protein
VRLTVAAASTNERRREAIRAKLADGSLPRIFPRALSPSGAAEATMLFGTGLGLPCSACGEAIDTMEAQISYHYDSGRLIRIHEGCDQMWQEELG